MLHRLRLLAVVPLALVLFAAAGGCRRHPRHDPAKMQKYATWFIDDQLDELDATAAQRQAVQQSKDRLFAAAWALHPAGREAHRALLAEWQKETPDVERAKAIIDERLAAFRSVAFQAVDEVAVVHGVLTPAQRAEVTRRVQERLDEELGVE
jgi:Spy/CpxP family protein refolding chaperone